MKTTMATSHRCLSHSRSREVRSRRDDFVKDEEVVNDGMVFVALSVSAVDDDAVIAGVVVQARCERLMLLHLLYFVEEYVLGKNREQKGGSSLPEWGPGAVGRPGSPQTL